MTATAGHNGARVLIVCVPPLLLLLSLSEWHTNSNVLISDFMYAKGAKDTHSKRVSGNNHQSPGKLEETN